MPVTLSVGDYILSRDICVERKEMKDFVTSLKSGRLFEQVSCSINHGYFYWFFLFEIRQNHHRILIFLSDQCNYCCFQVSAMTRVYRDPALLIEWMSQRQGSPLESRQAIGPEDVDNTNLIGR